MLSEKRRPFCLDLNVLKNILIIVFMVMIAKVINNLAEDIKRLYSMAECRYILYIHKGKHKFSLNQNEDRTTIILTSVGHTFLAICHNESYHLVSRIQSKSPTAKETLLKMSVPVSYDIIKWKHFLHYGSFVWGNPPVTGGQWHRALMFLWFVPEQTFEQTIEMPVIRDAIALIMMLL